MNVWLGFVLLGALAQSPAYQLERTTLQLPDGTTLPYGRAIPNGYDAKHPRPLVLALHPGQKNGLYYGARFMQTIFLPGLGALDPIMIAPDCPTRAWSDPAADKAVMLLIDTVRQEYAIDSHRILVVGYSLGGGGTWFMESHHADLFTAAIVMSGSTDEPVEALGKIPTYVIHSRGDEVVPFDQAERRATALERLGRPVKFDPLADLGHFDMSRYVPALARAGRWVAERWDAPGR